MSEEEKRESKLMNPIASRIKTIYVCMTRNQLQNKLKSYKDKLISYLPKEMKQSHFINKGKYSIFGTTFVVMLVAGMIVLGQTFIVNKEMPDNSKKPSPLDFDNDENEKIPDEKTEGNSSNTNETENNASKPIIINPYDKNGYIKLDTIRGSYEKGEEVNITLILVNNMEENVTFNFDAVPQSNITIYNSNGNEVFNKSLELEISEPNITLGPKSEKMIFNYAWNQKDKNGKFVDNGTYTIFWKVVNYEIQSEKIITIGEVNYIRVITPRDVYEKNEVVNITLILVNNKNETVTYYFGDYHQWDVNIYDSSDNEVWRDPYFIFSQAPSNITLFPHSEKIIGNLSWTHFYQVSVGFNDTEHFENASSIVGRHNGTIIRKDKDFKDVLVKIHENLIETFIEEILKEEGVKYVHHAGHIVLNGISIDEGKYKIHAHLFSYEEISGEKEIYLKKE